MVTNRPPQQRRRRRRRQYQQIIFRNQHQQDNNDDDDLIEDIEEVGEEDEADLVALVPQDDDDGDGDVDENDEEDDDDDENNIDDGELFIPDDDDDDDNNGIDDQNDENEQEQRQKSKKSSAIERMNRQINAATKHNNKKKHKRFHFRFLRNKRHHHHHHHQNDSIDQSINQLSIPHQQQRKESTSSTITCQSSCSTSNHHHNHHSHNQRKKNSSSILLKIPNFIRTNLFNSLFHIKNDDDDYIGDNNDDDDDDIYADDDDDDEFYDVDNNDDDDDGNLIINAEIDNNNDDDDDQSANSGEQSKQMNNNVADDDDMNVIRSIRQQQQQHDVNNAMMMNNDGNNNSDVGILNSIINNNNQVISVVEQRNDSSNSNRIRKNSNCNRPNRKNNLNNKIIDQHYYHYRNDDDNNITSPMSYTWSYHRNNLLSINYNKNGNKCSPYIHRSFKFELLNKNGIVKGLCPLARSGHRIVSDEHYVYLFGGFNPDVLPTARVPNDEQWSKTKPLFKELWRYSKLTQTWQYLRCTGTAPVELASPCALLLSPNRLLIYGGSGMPFGLASSNKIYICDLDRLHWSQIIYENQQSITNDDVVEEDDLSAAPDERNADIPEQAYGQAICYDRGNELIYVCGGTTGFDYSLNLHEFNLQTRKWRLLSRTPESIEPRYRHEMALYQGKLFIIGGGTSDQSFSMDKIPVFDLNTKQWSLVETKPWKCGQEQHYPTARYSHDCGQMGRLVYVVGGADQRQAFSDCWCLNLETMQWTKHVECSLPQPCYFHSATINPNNGEMFVFGGVNCVKRKRRSDAMYRCWFSVPTLQRMSQEAVMKFLHNNKNDVINNGSTSSNNNNNNNEIKRKKNNQQQQQPQQQQQQQRLSIKNLHEYFQCMQISHQSLNLPKF